MKRRGTRAADVPLRVTAPVSSGKVFQVLGLILVAIAVGWHIRHRIGNPWDFHTFYYAATAALRGLDPYRLESLSRIAGKEVTLPFLYPPITLSLFLPFTFLPLPIAALVWLGIKLGLIGALLVIWRREFLNDLGPAALCALAFFGLNAALLLDLTTGNVAVLEQLLLWSAFAFYVRDQREMFTWLTAAASVFKLFPISFLGLLLVPSRNRGRTPRLALIGIVLFAAVVFLPTALGLGWARGFLANIPDQSPSGEGSPSSLTLFETLLDEMGAQQRSIRPLSLLLWGLYAIGLLAVSRKRLSGAWKRRDALEWIIVASLLFALLSPRMLLYSYVLVIVPTWLVVQRRIHSKIGRALALIALVAQGAARCLWPRVYLPWVAMLPAGVELLVVNLPLWLTLVLWVSYVPAAEQARSSQGRRSGGSTSSSLGSPGRGS